MEWLKSIAPTIATVLGGPLAGMAVQAIGSAMGMSDATGERITDMLKSGQMTGEQVAALQKAELELKVKLAELKIKPEQIAAEDRASARAMQATVRSRIPGSLAVLITLGFFGILVGLMTDELSTTNQEPLLIMLGALGAAWGAVVNFYFGSSAGSAAKNDLLAKRDAAQ